MANDDYERDTIEGLWRILLRLVSRRDKRDGLALASTLHFLIERAGRHEGFQGGFKDGRAEGQRDDQTAAYDRGFAAGQTSERMAQRQREIGMLPDDAPLPETQH